MTNDNRVTRMAWDLAACIASPSLVVALAWLTMVANPDLSPATIWGSTLLWLGLGLTSLRFYRPARQTLPERSGQVMAGPITYLLALADWCGTLIKS